LGVPNSEAWPTPGMRRQYVENIDDHLVDADDLRLDRLGDTCFDDRGSGAGVGGRHLHLRWHDIGELRDRNASQRQQAGDRDDNCDDDCQPRPIDKDRRDHGFVSGPLDDGLGASPG
jgi:hypothetical protein